MTLSCLLVVALHRLQLFCFITHSLFFIRVSGATICVFIIFEKTAFQNQDFSLNFESKVVLLLIIFSDGQFPYSCL
jgi:hypothetical protein